MKRIDPVTQEILRHAFHGIAEEMAVVEYRSSFSPIIREMLDFSCGLFDARGRMIAHSEMIPAQLGLMQFTLAGVLAALGPLRPGDAALANHPYLGGTHLPDLQIFAPVHVSGRLIGYAGSIAHHIDVGGATAGSENAENTELYQEGLIFPPVLLVEAGRRSRGLWDLIRANVRDPDATTGDLEAQLSACRRGAERLEELCGRHGRGTVLGGMEGLLEKTSERARAELATWPRAAVEAEGFLDDDGVNFGRPVRIHARVQVRRGRLEVDVSGSSPQVPSSLNVPWASTHAAAYFAVRCFIGADVPQNDGLTRHVRIACPEGSILRPTFPAAVSARHLTVQRLSEVLCRALGELLPDRAVASSHVSFPAFVFQAVDPRSGRLHPPHRHPRWRGWCPPRRSGRPRDRLLHLELRAPSGRDRRDRVPVSHRAHGARPRLGRRGGQPGGLGLRRDYRLLADAAEGMYYVEQLDRRFGAAGAAGGGPGGPALVRIRRDGGSWRTVSRGKGYLHLRRGDVVSFAAAGGGGYGTEHVTA